MRSVATVPTRTVALTAAALVAGFPCLVVTANVIQRNEYSAAREAMSNLALGHAGWLMTLAFVSLGVGTLLMALVVRRLAPRAVVGPVLLAVGACPTLLSAVFQTDAEGAASTLHGTVHIALGVASLILMIASITASAAGFLRSGRHRRLGIASIAFAIGAASAVVLTFILPDSLFGVGQRLLLGFAVTWMLTCCWIAVREARLQTGQRMRSEIVAALQR